MTKPLKINFTIKDYPNASAFIVYGDTELQGKITVADFYYDFGLPKEEVKKMAQEFADKLNKKQIEPVEQ